MRLHELHVDAVDVGTFLPIDLDRHEVLVEHARRRRRSRTTRAPSRGTSDRSSTRSRGKIGLSSSRARAKASSPHGNQSTGLLACWSRYGLRSLARRFTGDYDIADSMQIRPASHGRHALTVESHRDMTELSGKRVAMLVEDEFEDLELTGPVEALRAAGATSHSSVRPGRRRTAASAARPWSRPISPPAPRA